ncbi:MAG: lysophospholipid acyltransferase family protein [Planctomycetia bacterium]|nr:lysophospholipid acyltransferase family protein [Planctomycetia bacterium]
MDTRLFSIVFLGALTTVAFGYPLFRMSRLHMGWPQRLWWGLNFLIVRLLWRTTTHGGPLPLTAGRGAIVTCNHACRFEPMLIETATDRVVHWMTAIEYFRGVAGFFLGIAQTIPTSRGGIDTRATRMAMRYLQNGDALGVLPEGRINIEQEKLLLPGRLGTAMMALTMKVPVIPCYIRGLPYEERIFQLFFRPAKVEMFFGEPIDFQEFYGRENDRETLSVVTRRILKAIATLAGHPGFEPEVVGRVPRAGRRRIRPETTSVGTETRETGTTKTETRDVSEEVAETGAEE